MDLLFTLFVMRRLALQERLAAADDMAVRLFYSHWNTGMCEWAARGFPGDPTPMVKEKKE